MVNTKLNQINQEVSEFKSKLAKKLFSKTISGITNRIALTIAGESDEEMFYLNDKIVNNVSSKLEDEIVNNFLAKESNGDIRRILVRGTGFPKSLLETAANIAYEHADMEANLRNKEFNKRIVTGEVSQEDPMLFTKELKSFMAEESMDVDITKSFIEAIDVCIANEAEDLVESVADDVADNIKEVAEKAKVTRKVQEKLNDVKKKIKEEEAAEDPDTKGTTPSSTKSDTEDSDSKSDTGDDTEVQEEESGDTGSDGEGDVSEVGGESLNPIELVKKHIPISPARFELESEDSLLSSEAVEALYLKLETIPHGDKKTARTMVIDRLNDLGHSVKLQGDEKLLKKYNKYKEAATQAETKVKNMYKAFRGLGIDHKGGVVRKDDIALKVLKSIKDELEDRHLDSKRNLLNHSISVESDEDYIETAIELAKLRSLSSDEIPSAEALTEAIVLRKEVMANYLISKEDKSKNNILRSVPVAFESIGYDKFKTFDINTINKSIYDIKRTIDPDSMTDIKKEAEKVKAEIRSAYGSNKYDAIVDNHFSGTNFNKIGKESLYESILHKVGMAAIETKGKLPDGPELATKSRTIALIDTSFILGSEALGLINKHDVRKLTSDLLK